MERCRCQFGHDGESDRCGNCVYGFCRGCTITGPIQCRRNPPIATDDIAIWPLVRRSDWCGEYRRFKASWERGE